jgi:hypothetical protein
LRGGKAVVDTVPAAAQKPTNSRRNVQFPTNADLAGQARRFREVRDEVTQHGGAGRFGIVLGLVGLGGGWRVASTLWVRAEALAEFRHPILCCFVGVVPVSTALVGIAIRPYALHIAESLAVAGVVGQLVFGVYRTGQLWKAAAIPVRGPLSDSQKPPAALLTMATATFSRLCFTSQPSPAVS